MPGNAILAHALRIGQVPVVWSGVLRFEAGRCSMWCAPRQFVESGAGVKTCAVFAIDRQRQIWYTTVTQEVYYETLFNDRVARCAVGILYIANANPHAIPTSH